MSGTPDILAQIKSEISSNPVMLYMKGTPQSPQCGFSAQVIKILEQYNVPYGATNVLENHELREGIKDFSNWPTIPQLYVNGKFVGGCDITMEMHRKGELANVLKDVPKKA